MANTTVLSTSASAAPDIARSLGAITLTNADNGHTVPVRVGDEVRVRLTGSRDQGITWVWSEPVASVPANLQRTGGGTAPNGDVTAVFRATGYGTSAITTIRRCISTPGHKCPPINRW